MLIGSAARSWDATSTGGTEKSLYRWLRTRLPIKELRELGGVAEKCMKDQCASREQSNLSCFAVRHLCEEQVGLNVVFMRQKFANISDLCVLYVCVFERGSENLPIMKKSFSNYCKAVTIM